MNVVVYALFAYVATAVISLGVVAVIVAVNRIFSSSGEGANDA